MGAVGDAAAVAGVVEDAAAAVGDAAVGAVAGDGPAWRLSAQASDQPGRPPRWPPG